MDARAPVPAANPSEPSCGVSQEGYPVYRGVAQVGSAFALGAKGRRFDSGHPDQSQLSRSLRSLLRLRERLSQPLCLGPLHTTASRRS